MPFFDVWFGIRKKILLFYYVVSISAVGIVFIFAIGHIPGVSPMLQLLLAMIIAIIGVVAGAFFSVILDLPNIGYKFDSIKNDIASKKIDDPRIFGERIVALLCDYFTFSFFSIHYAFFKITDTDCVYSSSSIVHLIPESEVESIQDTSKQTEEVGYVGAYAVGNRNYYLYVIPVWFGDEWLGCIGIFTPAKLLKIFCSFLADFENIYIDDQLVHVLNLKTQLVQKQIY